MSKKVYEVKDNEYEDEEGEEEEDNQKNVKDKKQTDKQKKLLTDAGTSPTTGTNTKKSTINNQLQKQKGKIFRTLGNQELVKSKTLKNYLKCIRCGQLKLKNPISFSCNHITCFKCLIKDLTLSQFKNCENNSSIIFRCSCNIGTASFPFEEFQKILKNVKKSI